METVFFVCCNPSFQCSFSLTVAYKLLLVRLILQTVPDCGRSTFSLACEQAPGGASAEQTFGAKRRAIGACTHSPKSPMSASKIWTQSGDWWILIIHDVVLIFTSGMDKNQNGERRVEVLRSTSFHIFNIYQVI